MTFISDQREAALEAALRELLRWFKHYPEMVPNPDRYDQYRKAIEHAQKLLGEP